MIIAVDGTIYHMQSVGGISRIYTQIMPRMADLDPDLLFSLYVKPPYRQRLPEHSHISAINLTGRNWRPSYVWRWLSPDVDKLIIGATLSSIAIWHATYFMLPPRRVKATLMAFYDATYQRFAHMLNRPGEDALRERQRISLQTADLVSCISQAAADDAMVYFNLPASKLRVVRLAPDPVFRRLETKGDNRPTPKPFLLYVGGRRYYKNFEGLLVQYSQWNRRHEFDLVVAGQDWSTEERSKLAKLGIYDNVHLVTNIDDIQLCGLYNQAEVFVYPSLAEGFGLPPLEAMACGCPVVAASLPAIREISGLCPFYFDPALPDSLMPAVEAAIAGGHDPVNVAAGQAQAAGYSWDRTARETLTLYRTLA